MANYYLNFVAFFKEENLRYYIEWNKLHICYAFLCTIQARLDYIGQLHQCHVIIIISLGDHMPHQL